MWHRPVCSIAVRCSSGAVMPLFIFFCSVQRNSDSQCLSMGPTTPKIAPSSWGTWTPSNTWFLGPCRHCLHQMASRSVQPFLQGSRTWQQWRTAAILKNWKMAISRKRFDQSAWNLAWWRILALQWRNFFIPLNRHIWATAELIATKFGKVTSQSITLLKQQIL